MMKLLLIFQTDPSATFMPIQARVTACVSDGTTVPLKMKIRKTGQLVPFYRHFNNKTRNNLFTTEKASQAGWTYRLSPGYGNDSVTAL